MMTDRVCFCADYVHVVNLAAAQMDIELIRGRWSVSNGTRSVLKTCALS